jgi:hypothetical protein
VDEQVKADKLEIMIQVDPKLWSDYQDLLREANESCQCGAVHNLNDDIEKFMMITLIHYHIEKAKARYR